MSFPDNLKHIRKQRGLTQTELADLIGTKKATISNYETGFSSPSLDVLKEICIKLNVSADVILNINLDNEYDIVFDHIDLFNKISKLPTEKIKALETLLK